mmetsp:Transcript_29112/g.76880  ORF Transcript_29112/g.76880 Transcript_29112/m.76880 type:complete len:225 (+) Transcript_29112:77-751(+)
MTQTQFLQAGICKNEKAACKDVVVVCSEFAGQLQRRREPPKTLSKVSVQRPAEISHNRFLGKGVCEAVLGKTQLLLRLQEMSIQHCQRTFAPIREGLVVGHDAHHATHGIRNNVATRLPELRTVCDVPRLIQQRLGIPCGIERVWQERGGSLVVSEELLIGLRTHGFQELFQSCCRHLGRWHQLLCFAHGADSCSDRLSDTLKALSMSVARGLEKCGARGLLCG